MEVYRRAGSLASRASSGYESETDADFMDMDFLMENGMLVNLKCAKRMPIGSIKSELWAKATQLPGANLLRDSIYYVFIGVTKDTIEREIDDSIVFQELDLVYPILEVSTPKRERDMNRLYRIVGDVCGFSIQSIDIAAEADPNLQAYRVLLKRLGRQEATKRLEWSRDANVQFFYPAVMDLNPDLPYSTAKIIKREFNQILITGWLVQDGENYSFDVKVAATDPPSQVVASILRKRYSERYQSDVEIDRRVAESRELYVLKVCGKEEFMLQECCIHAYKYFRSCINDGRKPQLHIVPKNTLYSQVPENVCVMLQQDPEVYAFKQFTPDKDAISLWDLSPVDSYSIRINNLPTGKAQNASIDQYVQAQIVHGKQPLSKPIRTLDKGFNQLMEFDVSIQSLPRCSRLSFIVCSLERNKPFTDANILSRLNVNIFDVNGVLVTGKFSKGVWESTSAMDFSNKYAPGLVGENPDRTTLKLDYEIFSPGSKMVLYPSEAEIDEKLNEQRGARYSITQRKADTFQKLDKIATYHPLQNLTSCEKNFLWSHREFITEYDPNLLPWLYLSINWLERHQVFEFYGLLRKWPQKKVLLSTALRLLGPDFVDSRTRTFAVHCFNQLKTTEQLRLYLPQLIQAYRFDCYMKNELGNFLVYCAWENKLVGHDFFWLLRCEMSRPQSKHKFAPLLEAYCLFCGSDILDNRESEIKAMKKYQEISDKIKQETNTDKQSVLLQNWLADDEVRSSIDDMQSTVDEAIELGELCVEECKLMTSKMRPLWLTWKNKSWLPPEVGSDTINYIVKCGDDLRQDMLVMQLLNVMDMLWKYTEYDFQLTKYECLAMENEIGLIQVVKDAHTLCDIEIKTGQGLVAGAVSSTHIHEWLTNICYQENRDYLEMNKRFTMSCAGYCVATYLLGLGDRHSDNIMISNDGKLFHIDFGHFMNHKKCKYGVNRERSPFVLTNEMIRVITRGSTTRDTNLLFNEFTYKCFEAFMVIRRNANIFITLMQMMMHCNIPELTDARDIDYFKNALRLERSDHEAAEHFFSELMKSKNGQWTVKVDWMFHRWYRALKAKSSS